MHCNIFYLLLFYMMLEFIKVYTVAGMKDSYVGEGYTYVASWLALLI